MSGVRLSDAEVEELDPYGFLAALGKTVIRPGGHRSTEQLFALARLAPGDEVLECGCGVGATAIELVRRYGCRVTAVDKAPLMLDRARENVAAAGLETQISVVEGDIQALPFADASFDCVIVEAVTMFVNRRAAVAEVVRVARPGGRVLDQEFVWRKRPDARALEILQQPGMCPGIEFDDVADWKRLYAEAGLDGIETVTGPFALMSPLAFVADEKANALRILARALSRGAYLKKAAWLVSNILRVMPSLGYVVLAGVKPT